MIRISKLDRAVLLPIAIALGVAMGVAAIVNAVTADLRTALGCGTAAFSIVTAVLALAGLSESDA